MAKKEYTMDWVIDNYLSFFKSYGMNEQNIHDQYELIKKQKGYYPVKDFLWHIFQVLLSEAAKQATSEKEYYTYSRDIHMQMWQFRRYQEGQRANDIMQTFLEVKVRVWDLELPYQFHIEVVSGSCCDYCNGLEGKHFTVHDVLKNQYIASKKCKREWGCNCTYIAVAKRDADGELIVK